MLKIIILIGISVIFDAAGQLLFKTGVNSLSARKFQNTKEFFGFLAGVLKNLRIWLGIICYTLELVLWLMVLSIAQLSFAFPVYSINYIFVILGSKIFLREKVGILRWAGTALILIGVTLIGYS